jgi:hypothetical protein
MALPYHSEFSMYQLNNNGNDTYIVRLVSILRARQQMMTGISFDSFLNALPSTRTGSPNPQGPDRQLKGIRRVLMRDLEIRR